jgi:hypothetical protein
MLWLVGKMAGKEGWPTRKEIVLAACDCAETALKYVPKSEDRPRKCIETVREWVEGTASLDAVHEARRTVYAYASDAAASSSASAYAAVYAAFAAVYAAYAADASAYAAEAGVPPERLVDIVRKRIPVPYKEEA